MKQQLLEMHDYHVWANQTMMNRLQELPRELYRQEVKSVFPTLCRVLAHIYVVDKTWMGVLAGKSLHEGMAEAPGLTERMEKFSLEEMKKEYSDQAERFMPFLREQDPDRSFLLDHPYAPPRMTKVSEVVLQLVNHGTYHRGNMSAMLRQMGHSAAMTEYGLYWYQGRQVQG